MSPRIYLGRQMIRPDLRLNEGNASADYKSAYLVRVCSFCLSINYLPRREKCITFPVMVNQQTEKEDRMKTMKRALIAMTMLLIATMAFGGVFGGIRSSNDIDAGFAPTSVTIMALCDHEATVEIAFMEVEITTTAELTSLMDYILTAELKTVVMINPTPIPSATDSAAIENSKVRRYDEELHRCLVGYEGYVTTDAVNILRATSVDVTDRLMRNLI